MCPAGMHSWSSCSRMQAVQGMLRCIAGCALRSQWASCCLSLSHCTTEGSDTLDHWKLNLTFDPVPFEDPALGVKVGHMRCNDRKVYSADLGGLMSGLVQLHSAPEDQSHLLACLLPGAREVAMDSLC
jgi:hypothetical protein